MRKISIRISAILLCFFALAQTADATKLLVPGGQIIGLELQTDAVTVVAIDDALGKAARNAGLQVGDRILKINNVEISSPEDVQQAVKKANGSVQLQVLREQEIKLLSLTPTVTDDGPRLGVFLKQGISGIGTVTFYNPQDKSFGALGHGVCVQGKEPIAFRRAIAYDASIVSVKKGKSGNPGQLMGAIQSQQAQGVISKNTPQGVFGTLTLPVNGTPIPVAEADEVHTGSAVIRSTVDSNTPREYSVEILKIYAAERKVGRNMLLKITDPALIAATGGIVQGMSGSPIIQDGKLIGAVTHVLVNDPTTGYGIFIENMLDAAA